MNIEKALQEMAKELLPNVPSEDDKKILSQLKKLYRTDREEFHRKLKRVNLVRRSEGLDDLHPNEIIGRELKSDIKTALKKEKEKQAEKKDYAERKVIQLPLDFDKISETELKTMKSMGGNNFLEKLKTGGDLKAYKYYRIFKINFKDGDKAYLAYKSSKTDPSYYELGKVITNIPYKAKDDKVLFPEKNLKFEYSGNRTLGRMLRKL